MSGFADIVRSGVAIAQTLTQSLQVEVEHFPWVDSDSHGAPVFGYSLKRSAIVEYKQSAVRNVQGETVLSRAKITILYPLTPNGATGRREPIDSRDRLVLPDGTSGPIVAVNNLVDPATRRPYMYDIYLG